MKTTINKNRIVSILLCVVFFVTLFSCSYIVWKNSCTDKDVHDVYISTIIDDTVYYLNLDNEHPYAIISKKRPENLQLVSKGNNLFQIRFTDAPSWHNQTTYLNVMWASTGIVWANAPQHADDFVFLRQKNDTQQSFKLVALSTTYVSLQDEIVVVSRSSVGTNFDVLSVAGNGFLNVRHVEWFLEPRFIK